MRDLGQVKDEYGAVDDGETVQILAKIAESSMDEDGSELVSSDATDLDESAPDEQRVNLDATD